MITDKQIEALKRRATKLKKESAGMKTQAMALDAVAKEQGYSSWPELMRNRENKDAKA